MTPTLTNNTVRIPIKPAAPEGYVFRDIVVNGPHYRGHAACFVSHEHFVYRDCPHPPGSKIEVREECMSCDGDGERWLIPFEEHTLCEDCKGSGYVPRSATVRSVSVDGADWVLEVGT